MNISSQRLQTRSIILSGVYVLIKKTKKINMKNLKELRHTFVPLESGGEVIVINTGATIDAEALAMLQALHSRSSRGFRSHMKVLDEKGAENFMANFYVGYGHASIGDCGTTTLFIEGVSMLAAKAIQDGRMYSGQEASTRYIDFQNQPFLNPLGTIEGFEILENWRKFYVEAMPILIIDLEKRYPINEGEKNSIYSKAIRARAFDILRGYLPAGSTTNLAWTTNLRQAADKLKMIRHHPLKEVRDIASSIQKALTIAHPNSFGHKQYLETETYNEKIMQGAYYYFDTNSSDFALTKNNVDTNELKGISDLLVKRPIYTELPQIVEDMGELQFTFLLDFGSYRDIQRHRAVSQRMPLLTDKLGFETWYVDELPKVLQEKAEILLKNQQNLIKGLDTSSELGQYYQAMGYRCSCKVTGNLRAITYLVELRATRFVHKTLRVRAIQMAEVLSELFGKIGFKIHIDSDSDRFDIKRGQHDINIK